MRPMSENQDIDDNSSPNSGTTETEDTETAEQTDEHVNEGGEGEENSKNENDSECGTNNGDSEKNENDKNVDCKDCDKNVQKHSLTQEAVKQKSIDKDRQSSVESRSHTSAWSMSRWSDNYESLDDDDNKKVEDFSDDPNKLILWAAERNEIETMRKLLEEDASLIDAKDNDLYTPLHRACYSNNIEVIKLLLSFNANIRSKTADGWEPLHCACKWDSVEAVSLLLQNGADINAQTKGHITPLHLAASNVSGRRTLELLLWHQHVDANIKNDAGDTAYEIACRLGPLGALFEILEESVNVY